MKRLLEPLAPDGKVYDAERKPDEADRQREMAQAQPEDDDEWDVGAILRSSVRLKSEDHSVYFKAVYSRR